MHPADERWPVLDGGPTPVTAAGERPWRHDGYRMHLAGRGTRLESVRAHAVMMDEIRHEPGNSLTLHADRVESRQGRALHDRWATALELPVFIWERLAAGHVSWVTPLGTPATVPDAAGTRLVLRSANSEARLVFEAIGGALALGQDGRVAWSADGASRLVAIAARDDADLHRCLDLLARRAVSGLGRQRVQQAEQLHRGGAAMRSSEIGSLADAFDWAKVRGDALLGGLLEDGGAPGAPAAERLALAMLAAGLSHLPRTLRRRLPDVGKGEPAGFMARMAAWTGEEQGDAPAGSAAALQSVRSETRGAGTFDLPAVDAIAAGDLDGMSVATFLENAIGSLWGVVPDASNGAVTLAPDLTRLGASAALSRLRIGRTVLDVRCRSRGELVSVGIRRGAGPPIVVGCSVRGQPVAGVVVDGVPMAGDSARFEVREAHDAQFHLSGGPPLSSAPS